MKKLKKTGTFTKQYIETKKGGDRVPGVEMWITHKRSAWLDTEMMVRWLENVYADSVVFYGGKPSETVLFMDGCSAHHTAEAEQCARTVGVRVETLPPNTTPILQPCDQYVNALFKGYYHEEWQEWYMEVGHKDKTKPHDQHSNLRRAKEVEVNKWIANATARLIKAVRGIQKSWHDTLIAPTPHIMHMAPYFWNNVRSMMQRDYSVTFYGPNELNILRSDDWMDTLCQLHIIMAHRPKYGKNFNIPVTQRKRKQPPVQVLEAVKDGKEEMEDGEEEEEEEGKVLVKVRLDGERYVAAVERSVVAAIKRRRVESNKENVQPAKVAKVEPVKRAATQARPFRIVQPWDRG